MIQLSAFAGGCRRLAAGVCAPVEGITAKPTSAAAAANTRFMLSLPRDGLPWARRPSRSRRQRRNRACIRLESRRWRLSRRRLNCSATNLRRQLDLGSQLHAQPLTLLKRLLVRRRHVVLLLRLLQALACF